MKVTSKGKVKLQRGEFRLGNFVVGRENGRIKVSDIGGLVSHRISEGIAKGAVLRMMCENVLKKADGAERVMQNYIAVMHNVLSCIPDNEFYTDLIAAVEACMNRHKDLYGITDDVDAEKDAEVLKEEREIAETEEQLKVEVSE